MKRMTLKQKTMGLVGFVLLTLVVLLIVYAPTQTRNLGRNILEQDARFISQLLADNLAVGIQTMFFDDGEALEKTLQTLAVEEGEIETIQQVRVFDTDLNFLKGLNAPPGGGTPPPAVDETYLQHDERSLLAILPIRKTTGEPVGYLTVEFSKEYLLGQIAANNRLSILITLIVVALLGITSHFMFSRMINNIRRIRDGATRIADGDTSGELGIRSGDEIEELATEFTRMQAALQRKADTATQIAEGNLDVETAVESDKDDLGQAMARMKQSLQGMLAELASTIEAQERGEMKSRCDAARFQGSYADVLDGVNRALTTVTEPIEQTILIVRSYADGDLAPRMKDLPGEQIALTNALAGIRSNLRSLIDVEKELLQATERGQLEARADDARFQGEYREIVASLNRMLDNILAPVKEAAEILRQIAQGDLTVSVQGDYQGDNARMKDAVNRTAESLNSILSNLAVTAEEVSDGANQVSDSSNRLSNGAVEQSSSVQEISAAVEDIASRSADNAGNAAKANELIKTASEGVVEGGRQMEGLLKAMEKITTSSSEISRINKVIDEIAFQTNLLALNAAVEAARAGVHGKGFAVVAEEVRSLAQRSAKAARETNDLIESSLKDVESGSHLTRTTAEVFERIKMSVSEVDDLADLIEEASKEQKLNIDQITEALQRVDDITQANSASAEESASAAQQLLSQAKNVNDKLAQFQLSTSRRPLHPQLGPSMHEYEQPVSYLTAGDASDDFDFEDDRY